MLSIDLSISFTYIFLIYISRLEDTGQCSVHLLIFMAVSNESVSYSI